MKVLTATISKADTDLLTKMSLAAAGAFAILAAAAAAAAGLPA